MCPFQLVACHLVRIDLTIEADSEWPMWHMHEEYIGEYEANCSLAPLRDYILT